MVCSLGSPDIAFANQRFVLSHLATGLAKNYEDFIKYIEERRFDTFIHNKAIQKAVESYRVSDEHKVYLKTLKIK